MAKTKRTRKPGPGMSCPGPSDTTMINCAFSSEIIGEARRRLRWVGLLTEQKDTATAIIAGALRLAAGLTPEEATGIGHRILKEYRDADNPSTPPSIAALHTKPKPLATIMLSAPDRTQIPADAYPLRNGKLPYKLTNDFRPIYPDDTVGSPLPQHAVRPWEPHKYPTRGGLKPVGWLNDGSLAYDDEVQDLPDDPMPTP